MEIEKLKIKKEDIENLDQLDRIEYKFDKEKIEGEHRNGYAINLVLWYLVVPSLLLYVLPNLLGFGVSEYSEYYDFVYNLIYAAVIMTPVAFAIEIVIGYSGSRKIRKLNLKYFGKNYKEVKNGRKGK